MGTSRRPLVSAGARTPEGAGPGGGLRRDISLGFIHRHASGFLIFKIFTIITAHKNPGSLDKTASIPYSVLLLLEGKQSQISHRAASAEPVAHSMVIIIIIIQHNTDSEAILSTTELNRKNRVETAARDTAQGLVRAIQEDKNHQGPSPPRTW